MQVEDDEFGEPNYQLAGAELDTYRGGAWVINTGPQRAGGRHGCSGKTVPEGRRVNYGGSDSTLWLASGH
jgi:hypothetical protein